MARSAYQTDAKRQRVSPRPDVLWLNVPAIVADNEDPEYQHRIKVIIPIIDEEEVQDDWVRQKGGLAGSNGYGFFFVPAKGSLVVLSGEFGQGENLYYECVYSEVSLVPGDFPDESVSGIRVPGDLKLICDGDLILEGGRILEKARFGTIQQSAAAGHIIDPEGEGGE
jgi:hypothetical protein